MRQLITPARHNEVVDLAHMVDLAASRIPLQELDCSVDPIFAKEGELCLAYFAPAGKAIKVSGEDLIDSSRPFVETMSEFIGTALVYSVYGLETGTSAHGPPKSYQADLPGHVVKWVRTSAFADGEKRDRTRPGVRATIIGRPQANRTVDSSDYETMEVDGRRYHYASLSEVMSVSASTVSVDIEEASIEVIDAVGHDHIEPAEPIVGDEMLHQLWTPRGSERFPDSAEGNVNNVLEGQTDMEDTPEVRSALMAFFWQRWRSRGYILQDDPYPASRLLQLASTVDAQGKNGRLYSPYEDLTVDSARTDIFLPDGRTRSVRIIEQVELERRHGLVERFRETGYRNVSTDG